MSTQPAEPDVGRKSGSYPGAATAKERERRNLRWQEWPVWLRKKFRHEVALRVRQLGEARAKEAAWLITCRVDAWRRRGGDAKACDRCGQPVLWRCEQGHSVAVDPDGYLHACEDTKRRTSR